MKMRIVFLTFLTLLFSSVTESAVVIGRNICIDGVSSLSTTTHNAEDFSFGSISIGRGRAGYDFYIGQNPDDEGLVEQRELPADGWGNSMVTLQIYSDGRTALLVVPQGRPDNSHEVVVFGKSHEQLNKNADIARIVPRVRWCEIK